MTKQEYFKLFEDNSHIGTKFQQDQIYEIALELFKNTDNKLFEKFRNNSLLITKSHDDGTTNNGTIEIEQIFDNLRFGYSIEDNRKMSSWFIVSNEYAGDYMDYDEFGEYSIKLIVKNIILLLKEQINNLFVETN
jgi:hypothetical protein